MRLNHFRRREFIALLGGATAAWPIASHAQQQPGGLRRIGVLMNLSETDPQSQRRITAFQLGLKKLGWSVGRNLQIDYRWDIAVDGHLCT